MAGMGMHLKEAYCIGEKCSVCSNDARHKIEEVVHEQPKGLFGMRHPLTAYVCCDCFGVIFGSLAIKWCSKAKKKAKKKT